MILRGVGMRSYSTTLPQSGARETVFTLGAPVSAGPSTPAEMSDGSEAALHFAATVPGIVTLRTVLIILPVAAMDKELSRLLQGGLGLVRTPEDSDESPFCRGLQAGGLPGRCRGRGVHDGAIDSITVAM
jgi:hypothetical protein